MPKGSSGISSKSFALNTDANWLFPKCEGNALVEYLTEWNFLKNIFRSEHSHKLVIPQEKKHLLVKYLEKYLPPWT